MTDDTNPTNGESAELAQIVADGQPWDPVKDETTKAFDAFCQFRDALEKRTMTAVAKSCNCSVQNISRWARRFRWEERALAYDAYLDQQHREEMAKGRLAMRKRQADYGQWMQQIGAHGLRELQARIAAGDPLGLSVGDIAQLMAEGSRIERAARGEGSEGRYTQIIVNVGDAVPDPPEPDDPDDETAVPQTLEQGPARPALSD